MRNKLLLAMVVTTTILIFQNFQECNASESSEYRLSMPFLIASHHFDDGNFNENNTGTGLQLSTDDFRIGALRYKNSHYNMSNLYYVGKNFVATKYLDLGLNMAHVTGYTKKQLAFDVIPMFTITAKLDLKNPWVPDLFFTGIPEVVIAVGLSWNLSKIK